MILALNEFDCINKSKEMNNKHTIISITDPKADLPEFNEIANVHRFQFLDLESEIGFIKALQLKMLIRLRNVLLIVMRKTIYLFTALMVNQDLLLLQFALVCITTYLLNSIK